VSTVGTKSAAVRLEAARRQLLDWLIGSACPRWSTTGVDPRDGGFVEAIGADGAPLAVPRRVRVQPRQVYAFARAATLGWRGDVASLITGGLAFLETRFRRRDGLYRGLVDHDGAVLDETALLYDHAFVLLGFAAAARALDRPAEFERRALEVRERIERAWRSEGGFRSGDGANSKREANPHMHLLEACLAWSLGGGDRGWAQWAEEVASLATSRMIDARRGTLVEAFTADWRPSPDAGGQRVEPGHQYEWAWLLLRCLRGDISHRRQVALRLIDEAERTGVYSGVAVNALFDDGRVLDPKARLWPQTERLKATLLAYELTAEERYLESAAAAATGLATYLKTQVPGLWHDERWPDGRFAASPAPASSFYHLVGAVESLASVRLP
jgi:mannose-6-phosphate isomerase